jgi:hypothetical protein
LNTGGHRLTTDLLKVGGLLEIIREAGAWNNTWLHTNCSACHHTTGTTTRLATV